MGGSFFFTLCTAHCLGTILAFLIPAFHLSLMLPGNACVPLAFVLRNAPVVSRKKLPHLRAKQSIYTTTATSQNGKCTSKSYEYMT